MRHPSSVLAAAAAFIALSAGVLSQDAPPMPADVAAERWVELSERAGLEMVTPDQAHLWVRGDDGEWRRAELIHPVRVHR